MGVSLVVAADMSLQWTKRLPKCEIRKMFPEIRLRTSVDYRQDFLVN